ncbi:transcription initiation factor TFIID 23-30kDa subunit-domain-containing protein, partial [Pyronema omphalodes]
LLGGAAIAPLLPPARKDKNLREFLDMMDEYAPIIPDAVTDYYLSLSGLQTNDIRLKRLLALATQKFIADIAADAYQYSRIRQNSSNAGGAPGLGVPTGAAAGVTTGGGGGSLRPAARPGFGGGGGSGGTAGRTVLTMEDLGSAVGEYGVNTRRPEFYR